MDNELTLTEARISEALLERVHGIRVMIEEEVKGGPGSGHHGHEGRPGQRGGSAPEKRRLTLTQTSNVVWSLCDNMEVEIMEKAVEAYRGIPPEHFENLRGITDDGEPLAIESKKLDSYLVIGSGPDEPMFGTCSGYYDVDRNVIHVHVKHWDTTTPIHELGHHFLRMFSREINQRGLDSALETFRLAAWGPSLSLVGLRPYSIRSREELFADMYAVWARGSKLQYESLARTVLGAGS